MAKDEALFVYGTLRPQASTRMSALLVRAALHHEPARVAGLLYHLGRYPGMKLGGSGWVYGDLVRLRDPEPLLRALDAYEGDEFRRVRARAVTRSSCVRCWVYVYAGPRAAPRRIPGGDYLRPRADSQGPLADNEGLDAPRHRPPRLSAYGTLRYLRRSAL